MTETKMKPATPLPELETGAERQLRETWGITRHKPATPLPYACIPWGTKAGAFNAQLRSGNMNQLGVGELFNDQDAAYIAHAANAYPRLVASGEVETTAWQIAKDYDFNAQQFANDISPSVDRDKLYIARELIRLRNEREALLRDLGEE